MRVYNLSDANHAMLNVALRRIKVSRIADLNDPFELLSANLLNKDHRKLFRSVKNSLHQDNGVLCFSKGWSNPVLWSHYADKHRGICLGFDVPDKLLMPVSYKPALEDLRIPSGASAASIRKQFAKRLLTTKFKDWAYEDEVHIFVDLDHDTVEAGTYFCDFSDKIQLRQIILGARCEYPISRVREVASKFLHTVHVLKARLAFTTYSVTENRVYRSK